MLPAKLKRLDESSKRPNLRQDLESKYVEKTPSLSIPKKKNCFL